jgi:hypothetical protein
MAVRIQYMIDAFTPEYNEEVDKGHHKLIRGQTGK